MHQPPEPGTNVPPLNPPDAPWSADASSHHIEPEGKSAQLADEVLWKERLYPNVWVWIIIVGLAFVPAVIFAPIDMSIGIVASVIALIILVIMMLTSMPTILVTRTSLRVGPHTSTGRISGRRKPSPERKLPGNVAQHCTA